MQQCTALMQQSNQHTQFCDDILGQERPMMSKRLQELTAYFLISLSHESCQNSLEDQLSVLGQDSVLLLAESSQHLSGKSFPVLIGNASIEDDFQSVETSGASALDFPATSLFPLLRCIHSSTNGQSEFI